MPREPFNVAQFGEAECQICTCTEGRPCLDEFVPTSFDEAPCQWVDEAKPDLCNVCALLIGAAYLGAPGLIVARTEGQFVGIAQHWQERTLLEVLGWIPPLFADLQTLEVGA